MINETRLIWCCLSWCAARKIRSVRQLENQQTSVTLGSLGFFKVLKKQVILQLKFASLCRRWADSFIFLR